MTKTPLSIAKMLVNTVDMNRLIVLIKPDELLKNLLSDPFDIIILLVQCRI
jgi:hypothetical protein